MQRGLERARNPSHTKNTLAYLSLCRDALVSVGELATAALTDDFLENLLGAALVNTGFYILVGHSRVYDAEAPRRRVAHRALVVSLRLLVALD